jgi:hypothetical protein
MNDVERIDFGEAETAIQEIHDEAARLDRDQNITASIPELKQMLAGARQDAALLAQRLGPIEAGIDAAVNEYRAKLRSDPGLQLLINQHTAAVVQAVNLEDTLRALLVEWYEREKPEEKCFNGDKQLSVRVGVKYEYETPKAVEWSEQNCPIAVKKTVDSTVLNATLKTLDKTGELPEFVFRHENVTAVIAKELTPAYDAKVVAVD